MARRVGRRWWLLTLIAALAVAFVAARPAAAHPAPSLMTSTDLGSGWTSVASSPQENAGCFHPRREMGAPTTQTWSKGYGIPMVSESVATFPSAPAAARTFAGAVVALSACRSFPDGTLAQLSATSWSVTVELRGAAATADYSLARTGRYIVLVVDADAGPVDEVAAAQILNSAVARLDR